MSTDKLDDLELLSAADPVRAEDAVAEGEAARALLGRVLATPAEAVEPPHRSRRRTGLVALAAAVVGLTVAVVLTSLPDGSPSIADRAYAAVSKATLYHVVVRSTIDAPAFLQRELDLPRGVEVMESWYDLSGLPITTSHTSCATGAEPSLWRPPEIRRGKRCACRPGQCPAEHRMS